MPPFERLTEIAGPGSALAERGCYLTTTLMFVVGANSTRVRIRDGVVERVEAGPFVMPSVDFALAAPAEDWTTFLAADPPPGAHDLMALLRSGVLTLSGNLQPLMANLMYFKLLLAGLRPSARAA